MSASTSSRTSAAASGDRQAGRRLRDRRPLTMLATVALVAGLGYLVKLSPSTGIEAVTRSNSDVSSPFASLSQSERNAQPEKPERAENEPSSIAPSPKGDLAVALTKADELINAAKYDEAIRTMNSVRWLATDSAPAYRTIGRALLAKGDLAAARDFLRRSIDLDPTVAETYFDHATASEGLGDLESALSGMRSYLHLETNNDPYRLKIAQARSAIWEWEAKLGRGPWGPTKGIPPGFTADQIKRDGKGVGIMMQKPETLRPDGTMDYEIKSGERQLQLWKK